MYRWRLGDPQRPSESLRLYNLETFADLETRGGLEARRGFRGAEIVDSETLGGSKTCPVGVNQNIQMKPDTFRRVSVDCSNMSGHE